MTIVRIARASRDLARTEMFYRKGLQFTLVDRFTGHAGYDGVILALPGDAHLEITQHARGRVTPPDPDDLLVLYLSSSSALASLRARLERLGHARVPPVNPWWRDKSVTFEDPDGWRVVLCHVHTAAPATSLRNRGAAKSRKARNLPLTRRSRT
jgi:catechol 2,3-dioxygenase-like lactoylglutathione lyase family enzyme